MPFCRKCGRLLPPHGENCTQCGTSTTGPIIKIKKASASAGKFKNAASTKAAKDIVPAREVTPPVKVIDITKAVKTVFSAENEIFSNYRHPPAKQVDPTKSASPHEIKQTKLSLEEDIITNPHDYETQIFSVDLECQYEHFWRAGNALPVSKGKAYCPKCGEQLRRP